MRTLPWLATIGAIALLSPSGARVVAQRGVAMVAVEGEAAQYWTRWRGPSGQGLATGTNYPDRWSPTENVRWRTAVPGSGNSSPVVWRDFIFLTTAYDAGARVSVLAYSRATGRKLWETFAPARAAPVHQKNGHASATAATDGERVYALFGSILMALDLTGKTIWTRDMGAVSAYHGPAGSPLLYKDRLIVYQDQSSGGYIAAIDTRTGKLLWRTAREQNVGWGTPIAVTVGDREEIIVNGQHRVQSYDPQTGREFWRCRGTTFEVIPTPVVGYGMVFCSSGRAGPTLAIRPGGQGDVTDTHVAWTSPRGSPFVPSPLLYGDQLYMVNDMASIVTAFHAESGALRWQGRLGVAQREGFSASPVGVDGKLFFTNDDGETFVLRAGPVFQLLHVNRLDERTLASPALVGGHWYFRTDRHLVSIGQ